LDGVSANDELERRLRDFYAAEAPLRAPDRLLHAALSTIQTTRQRRVIVRVPWRFPTMNSYAKVAVAAVGVIAAGAIGLAAIQRGPAPGVGNVASPTATPSPIASASPPGFVMPALDESFTSALHGYTMSYPGVWSVTPATEPWTTAEPFLQGSEFADIFRRAPEGNSFLGVASQALAGRSGAEWAAAMSSSSAWDDSCVPATEQVTIHTAPGNVVVHCDGTLTALAWIEDRGYLIVLYGIGDRTWFDGVLDTIQLEPSDAAGATASPSTSATD
jgi:hypothetical protein